MRLDWLCDADLLVEIFKRRSILTPTEVLLAKSERAGGKTGHQLLVSSKVFNPVGPGPNDRGLSRRHILQQVDDGDLPFDRTMKISGNAIRPGNIIEHQGRLWRAVRIMHTQPGKGALPQKISALEFVSHDSDSV